MLLLVLLSLVGLFFVLWLDRRMKALTVWIMQQDRFELRKLVKRYYLLAVISWGFSALLFVALCAALLR